MRVTRVGQDEYEQEDLGGVQLVPLIGAQGVRRVNLENGSDAQGAARPAH